MRMDAADWTPPDDYSRLRPTFGFIYDSAPAKWWQRGPFRRKLIWIDFRLERPVFCIEATLLADGRLIREERTGYMLHPDDDFGDYPRTKIWHDAGNAHGEDPGLRLMAEDRTEALAQAAFDALAAEHRGSL